MVAATSSGSINNRPVSGLPPHIFDKLVSPGRAIFNNIDAASLREQILTKLSNADAGKGIATVRELLMISPPTLLRIIDPCLTYVECNRFLSRVHHEYAVKSLSALEMMRQMPQTAGGLSNHRQPCAGKIPTGLSALDAHLCGGVPIGSVAELVGRAGVGKTHLALQLCVMAAKADGGSIFIDAEKKLSLVRMREIAFERFVRDRQYTESKGMHAHALADQVLENVTVHSLFSTQELLDTLDRLEGEILHRNSEAGEQGGNTTTHATRRMPVRLVVIDSIAAPIRRDFDMMGSSSKTAAHRASAIFQIAKRLKQLAYDYQLAVVVVNQVGSGYALGRDSNQRNNALDIRNGEFTASLGTAWQYCVSTRIVLDHVDDPHRLHEARHNSNESSTRVAALAKSLVSKRTELTFELTNQGLCEPV